MTGLANSEQAHGCDEIYTLHRQVLCLGSAVRDQLQISLQALQEHDPFIARALLIDKNRISDGLDLLIDDARLTALVQRGCIAGKLRAITCFSKAITDLERIQEQVARMAQEMIQIYERRHVYPGSQLMLDLYAAGRLALELLQGALESFDALDPEQAKAMVCGQRELAAELDSILCKSAEFLTRDPRNVGQTVHVLLMLTEIERIGENAGDLAEYVFYMVQGGSRESGEWRRAVPDCARQAHSMDQAVLGRASEFGLG